MANIFLYLISVVIWGTTWIAIVYQLGSAHPVLSIAYRFGLAYICLFIFCKLKKLNLRYPVKHNLLLAIQGICGFSLNYIGFYFASKYIASGLVSVIFTMVIIFNTISASAFLGKKISKKHIIGIFLGISGMIVLFSADLMKTQFNTNFLIGCAFGLAGTIFASTAQTLVAVSYRKGIDTIQSMTLSMGYGALFSLLIALVAGFKMTVDLNMHYIISLAYLVVFGSLIAFAGYFKLIQNIGPEKAAYATTLFPIIALALSTVFEGYVWTLPAALGLVIILVGNILVLTPKASSKKRLHES